MIFPRSLFTFQLFHYFFFSFFFSLSLLMGNGSTKLGISSPVVLAVGGRLLTVSCYPNCYCSISFFFFFFWMNVGARSYHFSCADTVGLKVDVMSLIRSVVSFFRHHPGYRRSLSASIGYFSFIFPSLFFVSGQVVGIFLSFRAFDLSPFL